MINFKSNQKTKTTLLLGVKVNIQKRFTGGILTRSANSLPRIAPNNVLTNTSLYNMRQNVRIPDTRCMTRSFNYPLQNGVFKNRVLSYGFSGDIQKEFTDKTQQVKKQMQDRFIHTVESENVTNSLTSIFNKISLKEEHILDFIKNKILLKEEISSDYLKKLLIKLNDYENLNDIQKEIVFSLKTYFHGNSANIEEAHLFLNIWKKNNYEFKSLDFIPKENVEIKIILNKDVSSNKKSYEEKKNEFIEKMSQITKKINKFFTENSDEIEKQLPIEIIKEWAAYLENRSGILPMQPEEIVLYEKFKKLYEKNAPKKDDLLANVKDNMKFLKENSILSQDLKENFVTDCYVLEDYAMQIKRHKKALNVLESDSRLSINDIKFLAVQSTAAVIDAEGTFKLTQKAYKSFAENNEILGFSSIEKKPEINSILNKIKQKEYFIIKETSNMPNTLFDMAHLGHKTMVIFDENSGKNIKLRIGLVTSTKDNETILLDKYQQTNPDLEKQNKKQYFRIFSSFIVVKEDEPLLVDIETTLLFYGVNSENHDITVTLVNSFDSKKTIWSENNYQIVPEADEEFLRNITRMFLKNNLKLLEDNEQKLKEELSNLALENLELYDKKILQMKLNKEEYIKEKENQQYYSLLSEKNQLLDAVKKHFEKLLLDDEKKQQKKKTKQMQNEALKIFKEQSKTNNESDTKTQSFKKKKEAYLKAKEQNNDE